MVVVIVSADPEWPAPLSAMLRERGFDVLEATDLLEAIAAARDAGVAAIVVNSDIGTEDAATVFRTLARRFGDDVRRVGVGPAPDPGVATLVHEWVEQPYRYVAVVAAVGAPSGLAVTGDRPFAESQDADVELHRIARHSGILPAVRETPSLSADEVHTFSIRKPEPVRPDDDRPTLAEIHRLLQLARFEPYEALLGIDEDASAEAIGEAAEALLDRLDDDGIPSHVADSAFAELAEVRAAIEEAAMVLQSADAREMVRRGRPDGGGSVPSPAPVDGL